LIGGCFNFRTYRGSGFERPPAREDAEPSKQSLQFWGEKVFAPSDCGP
jgi:hypothetical protein